jgi:hypothetical protein
MLRGTFKRVWGYFKRLGGAFKRVWGYFKRVLIGFKRVGDIRQDAWWIPCDIY